MPCFSYRYWRLCIFSTSALKYMKLEETSIMSSSSKIRGKVSTVATIIKSSNLSEVIKIRQGHDKWSRLYHDFKDGTEVLLQAIQKIKYGRIKILPFTDNEQVQEAKGAEYVMEHESYVYEEFLIPLKYHGKVRFVQRPKSKDRKVIGSQLLSERPRFVRTTEDTACSEASNLGRIVIIPAKTTLKLVRIFRSAEDGNTYIELSDGQESFAINETDPINFTCVEDQNVYSLYELVREKMLPRAIMIEKLPPEDAILVDEELNSAMMTCFDGPVELLGFQDVEVLVGCVRVKEKKVYSTVLIPKISWQTTLADRLYFGSEEEKTMYIKRKYGPCCDLEFIEKKMYFLSPALADITWLRNPAHYGRPKNNMETCEFLPDIFQESSDEDQGSDISSTMKHNKMPSTLSKNAKENPKLHSKTPKKIMKYFAFVKRSNTKHKNKSKKKDKEKKSRRKTPPDTTLIAPTCNCEPSETSADVLPHDMDTLLLSSDTTSCSTPLHPFTAARFARSCDNLTEPYIRRNNIESKYIAASLVDCRSNRTGWKSEELDANRIRSSFFGGYICMKYVKREEDIGAAESDYVYPDCERLMPSSTSVKGSSGLPAPPVETPVQDYCDSRTCHQISNYLSLNAEDTYNAFASDFFRYTTLEVARCLEQCAMEDLARKCTEHSLDGKFFQNLNLLDLKKDPLNIEMLHILKLRKIICDGWRPDIAKDNE